MILIAPDKFKGTLTARQAASIIASEVGPTNIIRAPMADGGEGTAEILCQEYNWEKHDYYYVNRSTKTAVIDSSAIIGLQGIDLTKHDILKASSAPLGIKVREILKGGCKQVVIGIGGTSTCDGGIGFLEGLGMEKLQEYRNAIIGLSDVRVPLVAPIGQPSALMFARQKGASDLDIEVLHRRLENIQKEYKGKSSAFDGAGGGLGFAIASVLGARCYDGAEYVLNHYDIDWEKIDMVITGEGCIDSQTSQGKVISVLAKKAAQRNIPIIAFGGKVEDKLPGVITVNTSLYYPELPLNETTATLRLKAAVKDFIAHPEDWAGRDWCTT